jgi:DNA-binding response OmpR family regulator
MHRILIVEDEKRIADRYTSFLRDQGYEVFTCSTASEAYDVFKVNPVDLVLLDINMDQIGGDELYRVLHMFFRDARVLVSSVYCIDEQKRRIPDASGYFDKAEGVRVLLNRVREVLQAEPSS